MTKDLTPASAARPCPVCAGDHKCSTTADGLILCGRRDGPQPGFDHRGPAKDPTWHLYRPADAGSAEQLHLYRAHGNGTPPQSAVRTPPASLPGLAAEFARHLTPDRAADLAARLGLPVGAVRLVPNLGWDRGRRCWTVPETDGTGHVVGIATRFPDGSKKGVPGGKRGLVVPAGWHDMAGPVVVVEGMSDAVALAHCGLAAVGRPSDRGGTEHLAQLLRGVDPARPVLVLGENDKKPDGRWPGRDGADAVAAALTLALGRRVLTACPPDGYKDARDWVRDRLGPDPDGPSGAAAALAAADGSEVAVAARSLAEEVGADIAEQLSRLAACALAAPPGPKPDRFPTPVVLSALAGRAAGGGVPWVWDGYLFRGGVTLLSALPKAGKTTLLAHLLRAVAAGGGFCGRPTAAGRVVVVSEEGPEVWADRRERLGLSDATRVLCRPFNGKPTADDWQGFLVHLAAHLDGDPADLVVFDTLADLWPVRDENSATDVQTALQPVRRLADGRAVLLVHHLRKSDGGEGTGSRGSGALAGFVDVICELRRAGKAADPNQAKRVLTAVGRVPGIPPEWVVELDDAANEYRAANPAKAAAADRLRDAIRAALLAAGGAGLTFKALWDALPADARRNQNTARDAVAFGVDAGEWAKENRHTVLGGPVYRLDPRRDAADRTAVLDAIEEEEERATVPGELFPDLRGLPD